MTSRKHIRPRTVSVAAGIIILLLLFPALICGCLDVEPEELPPTAVSALTVISVSPTVPADSAENISSAGPAIVITSLKKTPLFTEQDFPAGVKGAVSDFVEGRTTDSINGFLRWESVRAKTSPSDATRIQEQIHRIDYAVFNTSLQENITLFVGISGEQAKRIRNESVYAEPGYIIASFDPTVVYHRLAASGRDNDGYLTMCVIDFRKGSRLLYVNATEREFLLPHGGTWEVTGEETYEQLEFSADSIPHYHDVIPTKVRLIHTKEHF
jgi:hypothetical protein